MKKIFFSILLLAGLAFSPALQAQDAQRASSTKISDALNQLPANNDALFSRLMEDILTTGNDGVMMLTKMLKPNGQGTLPVVEYALNGLVQYVTRPSIDQSVKVSTANAFANALKAVGDNYNKGFFIRQLQMLNCEESLPVLQAYITDPELGIPAIEAITSIGGDKAVKMLLETQANLQTIMAFAQWGTPMAEKKLNAVISTEPELANAAYYALSKCGTAQSLKVMANAPIDDYLSYLRHINNPQNEKKVLKAVKGILKESTDSNTRCHALEILMDIKQESELKTALAALKDVDRAYRQTALDQMIPFTNALVNSAVIKEMPKLSEDALVDVITWMGNQKNEGLKATLLSYLDHSNYEVIASAVRALVQYADADVPQILAGMLTSNDKEKVAIAKNGLRSCTGDVVDAIVKVLPKTTADGKAAIMELLAARKSQSNESLVLEQLSDKNAVVKEAAAKALKDVATTHNRALYFNLLENAATDQIAPIQDAVMATISSLDLSGQFEVLAAQMQKAAAAKQPLYYPLIARTDIKKALDLVGEKISTEQYIKMINGWKVPGEEKLIFLRKALERTSDPDQSAALLTAIGATQTFLGIITNGKYLESKNVTVRNAAAMSIFNIASKNNNFNGPVVKDLMKRVMEIIKTIDYTDSPYDVQNIQRFLSETANEEGFVSIFNGENLDGWKGLVGNPISRSKMKAKDLAKAQAKADEIAFSQWVVEDGNLVFLGKGDNLCTTKDYANFEMYVDWMLYPEGPEADAGIYLRGTPQVQIWDTARVDVGAQVGSGGLYNNAKNESKPLKVADNKLGEWNSFFIRMIDERVTVYLNGELVVDNVIMENYWDRSIPIFPKGAIELQAHGSKVAYRDIYVRELPSIEPYVLSDEEKAEGFEILFDGTNMHKWMGNTHDYITENGTIAVHPSNQGFGDLYTVKEYGDFVFRFEFKLTKGANNGVGIRTPGVGDAAYVGMEIQVLDHYDPIYQPDLRAYQYHGSVYGVIPTQNRDCLKPVGEWNQEEIYAKGNYIRVTLNGVVITEGDISKGPIDGREHPGLFNKSGKIGFLGHGSELWFRNIRVKEL